MDGYDKALEYLESTNYSDDTKTAAITIMVSAEIGVDIVNALYGAGICDMEDAQAINDLLNGIEEN